MQASSRTFNQMAEPIWKSIMTIHLIRYCIKSFGRYKQVAKSSRYLIYQIFLWKGIFQVLTMKGTNYYLHIYEKQKCKFKLERSKMVLTERSGRYAVGYICMIVYTIYDPIWILFTAGMIMNLKFPLRPKDPCCFGLK